MPESQKKVKSKPPWPQYALPGMCQVGHEPDALMVKKPVAAEMSGEVDTRDLKSAYTLPGVSTPAEYKAPVSPSACPTSHTPLVHLLCVDELLAGCVVVLLPVVVLVPEVVPLVPVPPPALPPSLDQVPLLVVVDVVLVVDVVPLLFVVLFIVVVLFGPLVDEDEGGTV